MTTQLITRSGGASVRRSCVFTSRSRMPGSFPIIGSLGIGLLRPAWSPAKYAAPQMLSCPADAGAWFARMRRGGYFKDASE